jgi:hypothetical protein
MGKQLSSELGVGEEAESGVEGVADRFDELSRADMQSSVRVHDDCLELLVVLVSHCLISLILLSLS